MNPCLNFPMTQIIYLVFSGVLILVTTWVALLFLRKRKGFIDIEFGQMEPFLLGEKFKAFVVIKPTKDLYIENVKIKLLAYSSLGRESYNHYEHDLFIKAPGTFRAKMDYRLPFEMTLPERMEIATPFTDENVIWILRGTAVMNGIDLEIDRQFLVTRKGHP